MLMKFDDVVRLIGEEKPLHVAGSAELLKKLPWGNWIGGSPEYFLTEDGGKISGDSLFVDMLPYSDFSIRSYDARSIANVAIDAFDNGFSIAIVPFDSEVHKTHAENAPEYAGMFIKNIVGWVAGVNLDAL